MTLQRLKRILSEDKKWLSSYVNKASNKNVDDALNLMKKSKDMSDDEFGRENARIKRRNARIQKVLPKVKLESFNLMEANMSHFAHLGLDPNNPEHKDMVDAYNNGLTAKENKITSKPNQIKTFDQLKNTVAPHVAKMQQKRQEDAEDKEAFANKEAELIHHDPSTGVKVFKVRSGKGCAAAGSGATGCVYNRKTGNQAFKGYDPEGEHSYVIHTPEKGNLSRISIIGVKPGEEHISGVGGNFQHKGNNTVEDDDWNMLRKKYNLDNVKELHGIRGLKNPEMVKRQKEEVKKLVQPNMTSEQLSNIESDNPEVHKAILNHKNVNSEHLLSIAYQSNEPEVHKTIANHPKADDDILSEVASRSNDSEVHKAILNHPNFGKYSMNQLAYKSNEPEVHKAIANHPKADDDDLYYIAHRSNNPEIHKAIVNHPNVGENALKVVAGKSDNPEIHKAIVNHPNRNYEAVDAVAEKSNDPKLLKHLSTFDGNNISGDGLYHIARKLDDPEVHKNIVNHENVGDDALQEVAKRSNDPEILRKISKHYAAWEAKEIASKKLKELGHDTDQQSNPYHVESFLSAYKRVIKY